MKRWCTPAASSAAFVCQMEDVLAVEQRPQDPAWPQVGLAETSKQLVGEGAPRQTAIPGQPAHEDDAYVRHGVANLFLVGAPLRGWRHVTVTARRTARDFAPVLKALVDLHDPDAERSVLVLDNLNTHDGAALYTAFPPAEARRILNKLEIQPPPKHGSWLNMAEIEFRALARQCLQRRLPDAATLTAEVAAWEAARNAAQTPIAWRFTTVDARITLKHLYPSI